MAQRLQGGADASEDGEVCPQCNAMQCNATQCNARLQDPVALVDHVELLHAQGQGVVNVTFGDGLTRNGKPRRSAEECPQCGQCFVDAALLERHVKQVHKRRSECAGGEKCTIS
eukprot:TRINITY_DN3031_c0_g1_i6.p2 TRINITY_DN3031_c0_g1~~TRINITY_DN3031_c0_g1_i6.p2  ORF type:complete len:114 (+),score=8.77 TRINITY_DN3031_c0_g1_i6:458-799(+)